MIKIRWIYESISSSAHGGFVKQDSEWFYSHEFKSRWDLDYFADVQGDDHSILLLGDGFDSPQLDFSRGYQLLWHPIQKIEYAIASYCDEEVDDTGRGENLSPYAKKKWNEIIAAVQSYWPQFKSIQIPVSSTGARGNPMLISKFRCADGSYYCTPAWNRRHVKLGEPLYNSERVPVELVSGNIPGYWYGSIDHQSCGLLDEFLKEFNITLTDLFFDGKYVLFEDSDEMPVIWSLIDKGLIVPGTNGLKVYPPRDSVYTD